MSPREKRTLEVVERVARALRSHGAETALIGAAAAAVHNYPRATADIDLASFVEPYSTLTRIQAELEAEGYKVRFNEPDASDPLGGVLTVYGDALSQVGADDETSDADDDVFTAVQVVNFLNPFSGGAVLGREAIETAIPRAIGSIAVVDLAHLVALKLYAGGFKSKNDVAELLERNPAAKVSDILDVCDRHGLGDDLREILSAIGR